MTEVDERAFAYARAEYVDLNFIVGRPATIWYRQI